MINQTSQYSSTNVYSDESSVLSFLKKTYQYFGASLLSGAVGAYIGLSMVETVNNYFWGFFLLELAFLLPLTFINKSNNKNIPLATILLFCFTFVSGLVLTPMISIFLYQGMGYVILNAFLGTALIFGGASYFALTSTKDITSWGKYLMLAVLTMIIISLLNIFVFASPLLSIIISCAAILVFTILVVVDTQNIIQGNYTHPIDGAISLYLDFLNIFIHLLHLLGVLNDD